MSMNRNIDTMSIEELKAELERQKDNLADLEDLHSFTFGKTSVHIGAEQAQNMAVEYEEERRQFIERITAIEQAITAKGGSL